VPPRVRPRGGMENHSSCALIEGLPGWIRQRNLLDAFALPQSLRVNPRWSPVGQAMTPILIEGSAPKEVVDGRRRELPTVRAEASLRKSRRLICLVTTPAPF